MFLAIRLADAATGLYAELLQRWYCILELVSLSIYIWYIYIYIHALDITVSSLTICWFVSVTILLTFSSCSNRSLLRQWEQFGQAKIVLSCKNQQEMYATSYVIILILLLSTFNCDNSYWTSWSTFQIVICGFFLSPDIRGTNWRKQQIAAAFQLILLLMQVGRRCAWPFVTVVKSVLLILDLYLTFNMLIV